MQQRIRALQEDEELKPMFEDMKTGGMGAMMKYMNNPEMLRKLGQKIGPLPGVPETPDATPATLADSQQAPPPPPEAVPPPAAPEINDLLDAARYKIISLLF